MKKTLFFYPIILFSVCCFGQKPVSNYGQINQQTPTQIHQSSQPYERQNNYSYQKVEYSTPQSNSSNNYSIQKQEVQPNYSRQEQPKQVYAQPNIIQSNSSTQITTTNANTKSNSSIQKTTATASFKQASVQTNSATFSKKEIKKNDKFQVKNNQIKKPSTSFLISEIKKIKIDHSLSRDVNFYTASFIKKNEHIDISKFIKKIKIDTTKKKYSKHLRELICRYNLQYLNRDRAYLTIIPVPSNELVYIAISTRKRAPLDLTFRNDVAGATYIDGTIFTENEFAVYQINTELFINGIYTVDARLENIRRMAKVNLLRLSSSQFYISEAIESYFKNKLY